MWREGEEEGRASIEAAAPCGDKDLVFFFMLATAPKVEVSPLLINANTGDSVSFDCIATGVYVEEVWWVNQEDTLGELAVSDGYVHNKECASAYGYNCTCVHMCMCV